LAPISRKIGIELEHEVLFWIIHSVRRMAHPSDELFEHPAALPRSLETSRTRNVRMVFFGILSAGMVAVIVSMALDTSRSKHSSILLHNLNALPSGGLQPEKKEGGLTALAAFGKRVVKFSLGKTIGGVEEDSVHSQHLSHAAKARAASMGRLAALATKLALEDNNSTHTNAVNGTETGSEASGVESSGDGEGEKKTGGSKSEDDSGPHMWDVGKPGWDKSEQAGGWDAGDWLVWSITGPLITIGATCFMWYSYGPMYGIGVFMLLVACDTFALYYNV